MKLQLDDWQKSFLETEGDKILYCGRQVGKSEICGMDCGEYINKNRDKTALMIAPTERQAYALFNHTLDYILTNYPKIVKRGKDRPTQTRIKIHGGGEIWCLPVGKSGMGVRFLTINRLYAEEAARIPADVWPAVFPMLFTTGGAKIFLTTPMGPGTLASDVWKNKDGAWSSFKRFSVSSEWVAENRPVCATWTQFQKDSAIDFLKQEKSRLSRLDYAQEYLGIEMQELNSFFTKELIEKCMVLPGVSAAFLPVTPSFSRPDADNFAGVDIAQLGEDSTIILSLKRINRERVEMIDMQATQKTRITETIELIKSKHRKFNYKKIFIDTGGMGVGVFDHLLADSAYSNKVVDINNAKRSLDREEKQKKKLDKVVLYFHLRKLMEKGQIKLFDDPEIRISLQSITYEYDKGEIRITGTHTYSHITEALVRAAWCMTDKTLNIWAR